MQTTTINPSGLSYSQACSIKDLTELVFISGQVPETEHGYIPADFRSQCILTWENITQQLTAAGMGLETLVKITVFLSDRKYREENKSIREEILGSLSPALTIIITGIYEEKWLLKIEAIAAK
jgi:enamine deaminase RidA (YjgF/YER057c/UK114 family)